MIDPNGEKSHRFFHSYRPFVASVLGSRGWPPAAFAAWTSYYQYQVYNVSHWWARFGGYSRNAGAVAKHRFCRLGSDVEARGLKLWRRALKLKHLSVRTANDEGFKYSQLRGWHFLHFLVEKNEIKRLQLRLVCFDNNLFENDTCWASGLTRSNKNSGSLHPWNDKDCYDW